MAPRKTISVVIAARDSQATITLAVRSALFALGPDDEVLVFLDGCTDQTGERLSLITDDRLRIFESPRSVGRSAARNKLIAESRGDYIGVLDSDDVCLPWRFLVARRYLRNHDAVFSGALLFGQLPFRLPIAFSYPVRLNPSAVRAILSYRNPLIHSTATFRKDSIPSGQAYEEVPAEEYLLWVKMAIAGKSLLRLRLPTVGYRLHANQVSADLDFVAKVASCPHLKTAKKELRALQRGREAPYSMPESVSTKEFLRINKVRTFGVWFEEIFLPNLRNALVSTRRK